MTATPTPGDLSARHLSESEMKWLLTSTEAMEALANYHDMQQCMGESQGIDCSGNEAARRWYMAESKRIEEAWQREQEPGQRVFAALSALPAAGEAARYFASGPEGEFFVDDNLFAERLIYRAGFVRDEWTITDLTAPQPSAAEEVEWDGATRTMQEHLYLMTGERDRYKALHEQAAPTIARMERRIAEMDAAVGAQGDRLRNVYLRDMEDTLRQLHAIVGMDSPDVDALIEKVRCLAAPAAGKGVDGVSLADIHLAAQMLTWGRDEGLTDKQEAEVDAHAQKLFAALTRQPGSLAERLSQHTTLTRQPVAGDGMVLVPRVMSVDEDAWRAASFVIGSREDGFNDAELFIGEAVQDDGARLYGLHIRSSDYPEEGCITLAEFAAPAATPTDGDKK